MLDFLVLCLVVLAPGLTVVGAGLFRRWARLRPAQRRNELALAAVFLFVLAALILVFALSFPSGLVRFQHPFWLWVLAPLYLAVVWIQSASLAGLSWGRLWLAFLVRCAGLILLVLGLAGLQVVLEQDKLTVLFALDRSKSVPDAEAERALEFIRQALPAKPADDQAGLIIFGSQAAAQIMPKAAFTPPRLAELRAEVRPENTNIQAALRKARGLLPDDTAARLVLFTDGRQTEGRSEEELKALLGAGVDVWVAPLARGDAPEMLIEKIGGVDPELRWEQPFDARVFILSNHRARARVTLNTGEAAGPSVHVQECELAPGKNVVVFPGLKLRGGGPREIQATLEPLDPAADTLAGNNHAYTFTEVQSESRILMLSEALEELRPLKEALAGEKLALDIRVGGAMPENPEDFRRYDCILLANLPAGRLGEEQMAVIESCVHDQGAGLVMIGGDQSFGAGGYLNTPIERALPVSMDVKNQKIMPSGALVIVLHTCEFPQGNDWAKKISKAAINVLSPQDYAGLLYFGFAGGGGGNVWLFMPTPVARKSWMFSLIDGCQPSDMPDLDAIVSMAVKALTRLQNVSLKHCIIITDGDPSPPTSGTLAAARAGKITVTVVTIAPHGGADVPAMKQLAAQTGGSYYNPSDPKQLPQIFIKEAATIRKSLIYEDERGVPISLGSPGEVLREFGREFPKVFALVVTTPKERAELHLYTVVEGERVPILARWHYGLGKSFAFTPDSGARWAPQWATWESAHKFWTNLFQWVCRKRMPARHKVETHVEGNTAKVLVEALDEKGQYVSFARLTGSASEPRMGQDPSAVSHSLQFRMTAPGRYEAGFPLDKEGAYTIAVTDLSDPAKPASIVTGLANSYSREYLLQDDEGRALLTRLAEMAGQGKLKDLGELLDAPRRCGLFKHDLPPRVSPRELFWPLLLIALCLFPLDVAIRRLRVEPKDAAAWVARRLAPVVAFVRRKKEALAEAASEMARKAAQEKAPPPPLMPSGEESRAAQSRYEQAGATEEARKMDLKPQAGAAKPTAVGGAKISLADQAASEYTRALLEAKKRARKDKRR